MKLVTFEHKERGIGVGWLRHDGVVDGGKASQGELPNNMLQLLQHFPQHLQTIQAIDRALTEGEGDFLLPLTEVRLLPPLPNPRSIRDFYAFEEHVKAARARRGLAMQQEWYEQPVFYFSNHQAVIGPENLISPPTGCEKLDYELEVAVVIGKEGQNIPWQEGEQYMAGLMIMNDWSARDLQQQEMRVGLGPAKGKDFATSLGPYLVTMDELLPYQLARSQRKGMDYALPMEARVNGHQLSKGNLSQIYFTLAQLIEQASKNVILYPGDVLGTGTVGTGCLLELGEEVHRWLQPGDLVELEVLGLGCLRNQIG